VVGSKNFPGCGVIDTKILDSCVGSEPRSSAASQFINDISKFISSHCITYLIYSHSGYGLNVFEYRAVCILLGSNIGLVIKSRRMRWAGHVALRERRGVYRVLVGKPEGKNHSEDPVVNGKIILRWILRKCDGWAWTGLIWLRIGTGGGHL
jgi:hypothetical protein